MDKALIFMAMAGYMSIIIGIGFYYYKRSNESSDNFFLGGRSLGPWVAAISAGASDMSGWLLMGLPGVAYWSGLSDAFWTAIGLGTGNSAELDHRLETVASLFRISRSNHVAGILQQSIP